MLTKGPCDVTGICVWRFSVSFSKLLWLQCYWKVSELVTWHIIFIYISPLLIDYFGMNNPILQCNVDTNLKSWQFQILLEYSATQHFRLPHFLKSNLANTFLSCAGSLLLWMVMLAWPQLDHLALCVAASWLHHTPSENGYIVIIKRRTWSATILS